LSGDDRDENNLITISEIALQKIILEDVLPIEKELPTIELELEKTILRSENMDMEEPLKQMDLSDSRQSLISNDQNIREDESRLIPMVKTIETTDNHEINEDKSSAALSTLRKLKSKKV
jgi:hypothetical protein